MATRNGYATKAPAEPFVELQPLAQVKVTYTRILDVNEGNGSSVDGHIVEILHLWREAGMDGTITTDHGGEVLTYEAV